LSAQPSRLLYHYTDPTGMLGILQGQTIWATDAQYLNDTHEVQLAAKRIGDLLHMKASELERAIPSPDIEHAE
jgi:hypothetical protein